MAKFDEELPNDLIKQFEELELNTEDMLSEMTLAGAKVVKDEIEKGAKRVFKNSSEILKGLKITKFYKTSSDGAGNRKIAFYGYMPTKNGKTFKISKMLKGKKNNKKPYKETYEYEGVPIPLITRAREYGTSSGEKKKPFVRPAFNKKSQIREAMLKVQEKYLPKE